MATLNAIGAAVCKGRRLDQAVQSACGAQFHGTEQAHPAIVADTAGKRRNNGR